MILKTYRRFQITFGSNESAAQFIDAIRNVCPCKLNNPPAPGQNTTINPSNTQRKFADNPTLQSSDIAQSTSKPNISLQKPTLRPSAMQNTSILPIERSSSPGPSSSSDFAISSLQTPRVTTPLNFSSSPCLPSSQLLNYPPNEHNTILAQTTLKPTENNLTKNEVAPVQQATSRPRFSDNSSLPDSPLPSTDISSSNLIPPLPSSAPLAADSAPIHPTNHDFLSKLSENTQLYKLSRPDLENLVSEVVREDGFIKLVSFSFDLRMPGPS